MANSKCCPLVWMFLSASVLKRIENLQKRALRLPYNDYEVSYEKSLVKSDRATMNVNRLRTLCTEIQKTINNLNPDLMRELFSFKETNRLAPEKYMLNQNIPVHNQDTFRGKGLKVFGPKVRNSFPYHKKPSENLESFEIIINTGTVQGAIAKFVIQHKIQKDRGCLSKANLGLLIRPG